MICKTVKQMLLTATRNAIPMHSQGYTCVPSPYTPRAYWVNKPEVDEAGNPIGYNVSTRFNLCDCQFYAENKTAFPNEATCKHLQFALSCEEEDARIDAMIEESDARELEMADALNMSVASRADRAYDLLHGAPCHLHTAIKPSNESYIACIEGSRAEHGDNAAAIASELKIPTAIVAAYLESANAHTGAITGRLRAEADAADAHPRK